MPSAATVRSRAVAGPRPATSSRLGHLGDGVEHHVGVDGAGAVADQRRDVVDLARLAGLDRESGPGPVPGAHQVLVHGRGGEQRRDRGVVRVERSVRQHDDVGAGADRRGRVVAEALERRLHATGPIRDRPGHVEHLGAQAAPVERPHHGRLLVRQHRLLEQQLGRGQRPLLEQVLLGAEAGPQGHHDVLAHGVDRRVGHLGEALLEVGEQAAASSPRTAPARRRCPSSRSAPSRRAPSAPGTTRRSSCE